MLYQLYPRSFADSDGDGIGDLRGVIDHLDHLAWLGVDGMWLNPTFPSPNADWGFDVADYRGVDPALGTLDDLDELVAAARRARHPGRSLDLVPNHTSDEHAWFVEARASRDGPPRLVRMARPGPGRRPAEQLDGHLRRPGLELDEATGQYYLHIFLARAARPRLVERRASAPSSRTSCGWWFERGIAGFRIDVAHGIVKDRELRDNPRRARTTRGSTAGWASARVSMLPPGGPRRLPPLARISDARDPPRC